MAKQQKTSGVGDIFKIYIVDALSYMAMGLFCSLILGLIVKQISLIPGLDFLADIAATLQSQTNETDFAIRNRTAGGGMVVVSVHSVREDHDYPGRSG